jgi:hypothetical protein
MLRDDAPELCLAVEYSDTFQRKRWLGVDFSMLSGGIQFVPFRLLNS